MVKYLIIIILFNAIGFGDLTRPLEGQVLNYIHILFEWDQELDAEKYQIQVSETDSFDLILFIDSTTTPLFIDTAHIEWNQSYFWRCISNAPIWSH